VEHITENLFQILELPESFRLNAADIRWNYSRLSRAWRPDHFSGQPEAVVNNAMLKSELVNLAYKVLSDDNLRMKHILEIHGMLSGDDQIVLPREFLLEIMELNESIEELDLTNPEIRADVEDLLITIENDLKEEAEPWIDTFESGTHSHETLERIRDYYLKSKYLLRIKENIGTFADPTHRSM